MDAVRSVRRRGFSDPSPRAAGPADGRSRRRRRATDIDTSSSSSSSSAAAAATIVVVAIAVAATAPGVGILDPHIVPPLEHVAAMGARLLEVVTLAPVQLPLDRRQRRVGVMYQPPEFSRRELRLIVIITPPRGGGRSTTTTMRHRRRIFRDGTAKMTSWVVVDDVVRAVRGVRIGIAGGAPPPSARRYFRRRRRRRGDSQAAPQCRRPGHAATAVRRWSLPIVHPFLPPTRGGDILGVDYDIMAPK